MSRKNKRLEGKAVGVVGGISGTGSIISAHNVCHALCLSVVAVLSVFGIAVSSTALMFLEDYQMLFWSMGIFFLALSLFLYFKFGKCISEKLILFNSGLLVMGIPFASLQSYQLLFWMVGGAISLGSVGMYLKDRYGFLESGSR